LGNNSLLLWNTWLLGLLHNALLLAWDHLLLPSLLGKHLLSLHQLLLLLSSYLSFPVLLQLVYIQ